MSDVELAGVAPAGSIEAFWRRAAALALRPYLPGQRLRFYVALDQLSTVKARERAA